MRIAFLFITTLILSLDSCKTNQTIDPPPIEEFEEVVKIEDSYEPLGNDFVSGKVIHSDSSTIDLVAIKLSVNDSICVNSYGNFEGIFSLRYDKIWIIKNSYFEIVFRDYAIKKIPYADFPNDGTITLDKNGSLVSFDEYRRFYEDIRRCTK